MLLKEIYPYLVDGHICFFNDNDTDMFNTYQGANDEEWYNRKLKEVWDAEVKYVKAGELFEFLIYLRV